MYVIDASVVIKWFVPEIHAEEALHYLDDEYKLVAPDLLFSELGNILWKKAMRSEMSEKEAKLVLEMIGKTPIQIYYSHEFIDQAVNIALSLKHSVYDCLYLALAVLLDSQMVTADKAFYNKVIKSSFKTNLVWIGSKLS